MQIRADDKNAKMENKKFITNQKVLESKNLNWHRKLVTNAKNVNPAAIGVTIKILPKAFLESLFIFQFESSSSKFSG